MKKIIFAAAALIAFGFANAQDKKEATGGKGFANGDIFMSGTLNVSSTKTGDVKSNSFGIMPKVGFFVTDNIAVGGMIGFDSSKDSSPGTDDVKNNTFTVGAFGRWYATPTSDFSFMMELGLDYHTSKETVGDADSKVNGFGIALSPGVSYFLSNNFAMEASIGALSYNSDKPDADGADSTNKFGLNLNMTTVSIGLVYKF